MVATYLSVLCVYVVFIASSFKEVKKYPNNLRLTFRIKMDNVARTCGGFISIRLRLVD